MGISKVVGFSAAAMFTAFIYTKKSGMTVVSFLFLHASLVEFVVSIASHPSVNCPQILAKSQHGRYPMWSSIIFSPFLVLSQIYLFVKRLKRKKEGEPMYTEIHEGLYVGGWTLSSELLPPGLPAVIDCTCEFPRSSCFYKNAYLCIPTWDTRSPLPKDIEFAVRWACKRRAEKKPIYIHCANGHGRSVSVMCALLVVLGVAEDWKSAECIIKRKRPCIRVNAQQRESLEGWTSQFAPTKENGKTDVDSKILSQSQ